MKPYGDIKEILGMDFDFYDPKRKYASCACQMPRQSTTTT